ncbi:MAG: polysaccharide deacetylase family protein [Peptococcaceae bacterium]|nr:polysaccharide deacetylase family protein [Peptococcaceae bacterium]
MLKVLRNFIIGLLIGAVVFTLALPYVFFHTSPGDFYADWINAHLRQSQDTRQLARYFDDSGQHLPILTYRGFVAENEDGEPVTPGITLSQFEQQMKTLVDIGCTFITPQELATALQNGDTLPSRAVMITFDDCSEQIYTDAFPILQKYDIKATVNVIGYYVEHHNNYDFPLLTWEELAEMTDSGLVNLQSETYYSYVTQLNVDGSITYPFTEQRPNEKWDAYYARITKDLLRNNLKLFSETGTMPIALAYPYGEANDTTHQAMTAVGLTLGFDSFNNVCLNLNGSYDLTQLPRFEMNSNFDSMQEFILFINTVY